MGDSGFGVPDPDKALLVGSVLGMTLEKRSNAKRLANEAIANGNAYATEKASAPHEGKRSRTV